MQEISTLMDGELNVDAAEREIARLKADAAARETWDTYHLIGDTMRNHVSAASGFTSRFRARLTAEPTVLAPRTRTSRKVHSYALSAAASVAAVAVVGWMAFNVMKPDAPASELVKAPAVQPSATATPVTTANVAAPQPAAAPSAPIAVATPAEHVHEYLLAHQGISPTTAIQGVTPYIRTVSNNGE